MASLDQLNVATERYIRDTPALVDDVSEKGVIKICGDYWGHPLVVQ
jgi:hypothetical protein